MSHRFLGETIERIKGKGAPEALEHHSKAYELKKDFPPYLANLGRYWLRVKEPQKFIDLLNGFSTEKERKAIDNQVCSIHATCLERVGDPQAASDLRMSQIQKGGKNPVFYNDEAQYFLECYETDKNSDFIANALKIIEMAEKNNATGEYTHSIKAKIFAAKRKSGDAS